MPGHTHAGSDPVRRIGKGMYRASSRRRERIAEAKPTSPDAKPAPDAKSKDSMSRILDLVERKLGEWELPG